MITEINQHSQLSQACWRTIGVWGNQLPRCSLLDNVTHCRNCDVFKQAAETLQMSYSNETLQIVSEQLPVGDCAALLFRMGEQWFGILPNTVHVVAPLSKIHSLPRQDRAYIRGIVAINGEIHSCLALEKLFGLALSNKDNSTNTVNVYKRQLLVNFCRWRFVFLVDELKDIYRFFKSDIAEISTQFNDQSRALLSGEVTCEMLPNQSFYYLDNTAIEQWLELALT